MTPDEARRLIAEGETVVVDFNGEARGHRSATLS
jgi:hypothetical protein